MALAALEVPEILLHIFQIGSKLDLDDYREALLLNSPGCQSPSLKPFFKPMVQVKKQWRELAISVPSFSVTRVSLCISDPLCIPGPGELLYRREDYARAEEVLNASDTSDIDFYISLPMYPYWQNTPENQACLQTECQNLQKWLEKHLFSLSHRVRILRIGNYLAFEGILNCAATCKWPKLRALSITGGGDYKLSHLLAAPQLDFASFNGILWKEPLPPSFIASISALHVSIVLRGLNLASFLPPASSPPGLTELKLSSPRSSAESLVSELQALKLHLPQLERMSLNLAKSSQVWKVLECVHVPSLKKLELYNTDPIASSIPVNMSPVPCFPKLETLMIEGMIASWASLVLSAVSKSSQLSTLILHITQPEEDGGNPDVDLDSDFHKILLSAKGFDYLKNLSVSLSDTDRLFSPFNLNAVTGHISIFAYGCTARGDPPCHFPHARKLTGSRTDLGFVVTPSLRCLALSGLPYRAGDGPIVPPSGPNPVTKLETLELLVDRDTTLPTDVLAPVNDIQSLVLRIDRDPSNHASYITSGNLLDASSPSDSYLPNLQNLELDFLCQWMVPPIRASHLKQPCANYSAVLQMVRNFIVKREEQGRPLQTLRLRAILPGLSSDPTFQWLQSELGNRLEVISTPRVHDFDLGFRTVV